MRRRGARSTALPPVASTLHDLRMPRNWIRISAAAIACITCFEIVIGMLLHRLERAALDEEILARAESLNAAVITRDRDFSSLASRPGRDKPSVLSRLADVAST